MIHIIHGIHSSEGKKSTPASLVPDLIDRRYKVRVHDYGYAMALTSRYKNPKRAEKIAPLIQDGDIIIGHSNGCHIASLIVGLGVKVEGLVMLQPALDKDWKYPDGDYWINVFHNKNDRVTWLARFWPFGHPYGSQGTYGHKGDQRSKNYNTLRLCNAGGHFQHIQSNQCVRNAIVNSIEERCA